MQLPVQVLCSLTELREEQLAQTGGDYLGVPALAVGLDWMIFQGPFQPLIFCDYVRSEPQKIKGEGSTFTTLTQCRNKNGVAAFSWATWTLGEVENIGFFFVMFSFQTRNFLSSPSPWKSRNLKAQQLLLKLKTHATCVCSYSTGYPGASLSPPRPARVAVPQLVTQGQGKASLIPRKS